MTLHPRALIAALAVALTLATPLPAPAQVGQPDWTDPQGRVMLPEPYRTRGLRAPAPAAAPDGVEEPRSFVPIAPVVPPPPRSSARTWKVCNSTQHDTISVAIAVPSRQEWLVRGWLLLNQGQCRTVLQGVRVNEVYYLSHPTDTHFTGWQTFCIRPDTAFQVLATSQCADGFVEASFRRVVLDRADIRTDIR